MLYDLNMILAVGYRVRSARGTQFRQWATRHLNEFMVKGFIMDDARLKDPAGWDYFDELLDRIRDIPEVRVMRGLSPAYHVVSVTSGSDGTELVCRDLRTRTFNTRFGELNLVLDAAGAPRRVVFHV